MLNGHPGTLVRFWHLSDLALMVGDVRSSGTKADLVNSVIGAEWALLLSPPFREVTIWAS